MANAKINTLMKNIQKVASTNFSSKSCIQFMDETWGLCRDGCESRLTGLLGGFQGLYRQGLSEDIRVGCDKICKFLEQFIKLIRARDITTAVACKQLIAEGPLAVGDIDTLIANITMQVAMNTPDIRCIADALVSKDTQAPQYVVGYSQITSTEVITKQGALVIGSGENRQVRDVPTNIRALTKNDTWFVSTVTSNIDADRLDNCNQHNTTMASRKKLYPIFARVPAENIDKLKQLLPDCDKTCIPGWVCEVKPAFPKRKGR